MKKKILLLITLMAVMVLAVNTRQKNDTVAVETNETPQHSFLTMAQTKDATVAQHLAEYERALNEWTAKETNFVNVDKNTQEMCMWCPFLARKKRF